MIPGGAGRPSFGRHGVREARLWAPSFMAPFAAIHQPDYFFFDAYRDGVALGNLYTRTVSSN